MEVFKGGGTSFSSQCHHLQSAVSCQQQLRLRGYLGTKASTRKGQAGRDGTVQLLSCAALLFCTAPTATAPLCSSRRETDSEVEPCTSYRSKHGSDHRYWAADSVQSTVPPPRPPVQRQMPRHWPTYNPWGLQQFLRCQSRHSFLAASEAELPHRAPQNRDRSPMPKWVLRGRTYHQGTHRQRRQSRTRCQYKPCHLPPWTRRKMAGSTIAPTQDDNGAHRC